MSEPVLRHTTASDAPAVHALVCASGMLDRNSPYAYAATLEHFGDTCVVAADGRAGFVTAYRLPARPDVLFVWQVGVAVPFRARGLGTTMLRWLVDALGWVRFVETTVTPGNAASRRLFRRLAEGLHTGCRIGPGFGAELLGPGHEPEDRFCIGPLPRTHP